MKRDLSRFKQLIRGRCGLMFEGNSEANLIQVLAERASALTLAPERYYAHLQGSVAEFQELVNRLTINETYFFRGAEQIHLLVDHLVPRFLARREGTAPLRILSAGCSSGEEPYSLAMALMDKYGEHSHGLFDIHGADIDSAALTKARNARYTRFSFRGVPEAVQIRYFDKDSWGQVLKATVRKQVSFHMLNLLTEPIAPTLHDFDIIFFRNVSIYFDAPTRQHVLHTLASMMKAQAVLITGAAETLANDLWVLPLVEEAGQFYFVKGTSTLPVPAPQTAAASHTGAIQTDVLRGLPPHPGPLPEGEGVCAHQFQSRPNHTERLTSPEPPSHTGTGRVAEVLPKFAAAGVLPADLGASQSTLGQCLPAPSSDFEALHKLVRDKLFDQALPLLDRVFAQDAHSTWARLLKAHVLINRKEFATAEHLAQEVLASDAWSVDALLLLGQAAKWQQQPEAAVRWFKQAAYARHECWPAQYYLADLYRQGGNTELARRAYRVVLQLLSGKEADTGIACLPLDLPVVEVRFLCEHQLARLPVARALAGQG